MLPFHTIGGADVQPARPPAMPVTPSAPCDICIGPAIGCRRSASGVVWCRRRADSIPGYRIVARRTDATGYRRRSATPPASDAIVGLAAWLAEHGPEALAQVRDALDRAEGPA